LRIKTRIFLLTSLLFPVFAPQAIAADQHGSEIFHAFRLESDYGVGKSGPVARWDFKGWIGGDYNKLWIRNEGTNTDGRTEQAEMWALYSRNIATFWDAQAGIRYDAQPTSTSYLAVGFNGLAPYYFETEAHLFVSDAGDVSARLHEENDFLLSQRLILQPYAEVNLFAQDVPKLDAGRGLADGEIGLQTRYEITRKFAPYIDLRYVTKFGETSSMAKHNGEENDDFIAAIGLRLMF
jgi:copper resistance protein B